MSDVPETIRAMELLIEHHLSPTTGNPTENWVRYLGCLRVAEILHKTTESYKHHADESMD